MTILLIDVNDFLLILLIKHKMVKTNDKSLLNMNSIDYSTITYTH